MVCGHCLVVLPLLKLRNTVTSLLISRVQNKYRSDTVALITVQTVYFSGIADLVYTWPCTALAGEGGQAKQVLIGQVK